MVQEIQVSLCCDGESQEGLVSLIIYVLTSPRTLFLRFKLLVDEHSASEDLPYTVSTTRGYRQQEPVDNVMVGVALGKVFSGLLNVFEKVAQRATPILIPPTTIYMNEINDSRNPQIQ